MGKVNKEVSKIVIDEHLLKELGERVVMWDEIPSRYVENVIERLSGSQMQEPNVEGLSELDVESVVLAIRFLREYKKILQIIETQVLHCPF